MATSQVCRNGHQLDLPGAYYQQGTKRVCRECDRERCRRYRARKRGKILIERKAAEPIPPRRAQRIKELRAARDRITHELALLENIGGTLP